MYLFMHYGEGDAMYYPNFLTKDEADDCLTRLSGGQQYIPRKEMTLKIYGKVIPLPRDKAFFGDVATDSSVMTLSLGGARRLQLQNMETKEKHTVLLEHGSLFVLGPKTNASWKHSLLKGSWRERCETRLGLTYRHIATQYNSSTEEVRMNAL